MAAEPLNPEADAAQTTATAEAAEAAQRALKEALALAEKRILEAARTAERVIKDSVEAIKAQAKTYTGAAPQSVEEAQRYVVERVKERPVTAALAGVGVGFLLGVLISGRK